MSESLLAIDPSSSAAGLAFFPSMDRRQHPTHLHVVRPPAKWDAMMRINHIVDCLLETVRMRRPSIVVVEMTDGKSDVRRSKQRGRPMAGLAVLGNAQGQIYRALVMAEELYGWPDYKVHPVSETEWTAGSPKTKRAMNVRLIFPEYREFADDIGDPGLDCADAIGMALWYIGQREQREAVERAGQR